MLIDCGIMRDEGWRRDVLFSTRNNTGDSSVSGGGAEEGESRGQEGNFGVRHLEFCD